ncbi:MAG TPA: DEAD/DEAH box helicase, partial [Candidatus Saccharimonadales bacterium]|nr:DEAD/DEAH box helicase [Candidatus Saccharimonadales bacterium]
MELTSPVTELKGVGAGGADKLAILGVKTIGDLIENYPRRYEDYSQVSPIAQLRPGVVTIKAKISLATGRYVRRGMHITEAIASDDTASVRLVWFNQPYRAGAIKAGQDYYIAGDYALRRNHFSLTNPSVELVSGFPVNAARIIPVYRETKGLKSNQIRRYVREAINVVKDLPEHLPTWLIDQTKLKDYAWAATEIHFPSSAESLAKAKRRLAFEEVFELTLAALLNKQAVAHEKGIKIEFQEELAQQFVKSLPFSLTDVQRKAVWRIYQDMAQSQPMNRLLEGDVGSGKTLVAAMAALMAMAQGFQAALMAPTEILARQHAETLFKLLSEVGYGEQTALLLGSLKPAQKTEVQAKIADGSVKLMIGTQALIAEKVDMHKLGLIIIDEQHRFGVAQRQKLQAKAGHMPHVLHM